MSFATGRQALELGSQLSTKSCGIVFFGGEPLLCTELIKELVSCALEMERNRSGRFHFKITTNGTLLNDSFLEFAMQEDVFVALSVDGIRRAHDVHRRTPTGGPTFDVVIARLRRLLEVRPYSSILMVVNPETAIHLAESVEFLLDEGARYLIVSLNHAAEWTEETLAVLRDQYEVLADRYIDWTLAGRKFFLSPFEVKLSSHIKGHCHQAERCELARHQLSVDPQGWLFPCVQFTQGGPQSRWCIGHVARGVDEIARQRIHDESQAEKELCKSCAVRHRCNHTCGCLNWQTTGSLNQVSPVLCRHEQMLLPIADRLGKKLYRARSPLFLHKHYNAAYPVLSLLEDHIRAQQPEGRNP